MIVDSSYVDESVQSSIGIGGGHFYGDDARQSSSLKKRKKLKEPVII